MSGRSWTDAANAAGAAASVPERSWDGRDRRRSEFPSRRAQRIEETPALAAEDEILTSEEARNFLKIGRTKLWDLTKKNLIPAYRVGTGKTSSLRYKRSELMRWLENSRI